MGKGEFFIISYVGGFKNDKYCDYGEFKWTDGKYYKVGLFLTRDPGKMASTMEKGNTLIQQRKNQDFGNMANLQVDYFFLLFINKYL